MRRLLIILACLTGMASLVRHFPLSWAGSVLPDEVGSFSGTIWNGQVSQVPLLGAVQVKGTLGGARLMSASGDVTFSGDVSPGGVKDLILSMPVARLPISDARLAGLDGRVSLRIDEAKVEDGTCVSATGQASTDVLAINGSRFQWSGPSLSGPVDCIDGRLRVRLNGAEGSETVNATILTGLDGIYQTDISVQSRDPSAGNALVLFGFTPAADGQFTLSEQGRWR